MTEAQDAEFRQLRLRMIEMSRAIDCLSDAREYLVSAEVAQSVIASVDKAAEKAASALDAIAQRERVLRPLWKQKEAPRLNAEKRAFAAEVAKMQKQQERRVKRLGLA